MHIGTSSHKGKDVRRGKIIWQIDLWSCDLQPPEILHWIYIKFIEASRSALYPFGLTSTSMVVGFSPDSIFIISWGQVSGYSCLTLSKVCTSRVHLDLLKQRQSHVMDAQRWTLWS